MAYVVNEFGRSVTGYTLDDAAGVLAEIQTLSIQQHSIGNMSGPNTGGADIHLTPDGRFLYASSRGPDNIAAYRIDPISGLMTPIAQYPTERMPRSFSIDPDGKYLYVAGQKSGQIAAYKIDSLNGQLKQLRIYTAGSNPTWITTVRIHDSGRIIEK
jgi:6-phosphogluconolactonase